MTYCHVPPLATCDACMTAFAKQRRDEENARVDAANLAHIKSENRFIILTTELENCSSAARSRLLDILEEAHALEVEHPCCATSGDVERLLNFLRSTHFFEADKP